jgi:hypothetical protein
MTPRLTRPLGIMFLIASAALAASHIIKNT